MRVFSVRNYSLGIGFLLVLLAGCNTSDDNEVEPLPSDINGIVSLTVSEGDLSPAFSLLTTSYAVDVGNEIESIQVTATVEHSSVTLQINGITTLSGTASSAISLEVGSNLISVTGTAESGLTRTITIDVIRAVVISDNSRLTSLTVSVGQLAPNFSPEIQSYAVSVESETESVTVTPTAEDINATIQINSVEIESGMSSDPIAIPVGTTTISLVATAQDGTTTRSYSVEVNREAPLSNNANLTAIALSGGSISPAFDSDVLEYSASVGFSTTSITTTFTLADINASVTINGQITESGVPSSDIALQEGSNTITYIILAEDGITTKTYTIIITRQAASTFAQDAYIKASNTDTNDLFGEQVAIFGDTLAVGANLERSGVQGDESDNSLNGSGAVYVYAKNAQGEWGQQAYLKSSNFVQDGNSGIDHKFGTAIALAQDILVVGAPGESSLSTGINGDETNTFGFGKVGAVYVFTRSGETWTQQAYIKASNAGVGDSFGVTVAISDDGNTLAVGATGESSLATGINGDETDSSGGLIGAVYIFTRSETTWTQQAYVKPSMTLSAPYNFGAGLALSENGNSLAVGAPSESGGSTGVNGDQNYNSSFINSGAVYVYTRSDITWSQQAYVKASNTEKSDFFGYSIALSGNTLAVGTFTEDSIASGINGDQSNGSAIYGSDYNSGAVYVFERDSSDVWSQEAYVKASNTNQGALFGTVSLSNNGSSMIVGAIQDVTASTGVDGDESLCCTTLSGAAYLYAKDAGGVWIQQNFIKASNTGISDNFGSSVSLDANGNVAIGAFHEDSNATGVGGDQGDNTALDSGAVYVLKATNE